MSGGLTPDIHPKLFDTLIMPILLYGSEIWGCNTHVCIEKVQTRLWEISNNSVSSMDDSSAPKAALNMPVTLDESGKTNWVTHIKNLLLDMAMGVCPCKELLVMIKVFLYS